MAESVKVPVDITANSEVLAKLGAQFRGAAEAGKAAAGQINTGFAQVGEHVNKVTAAFRDLRRVFLLAFAAHEVVDFTSSIVEANKQAQKIVFTLQAVAGSAQGASAEFKFVSQISKRLGLDLASTAAGYARLAASAKEAGLPQQELHKGFVGLSEALTVLRAPADEVNRILVQLDQGLSLGKIQMQDLRAISNSLPGVFGLVQEALKGTGKNLQDMLKNGGIPAQEFFERFTALLHDKYGPEAEKASQGLNASLNRLKTTIFGLETEPSGFVESFTTTIQNLNKQLNDPAIGEGLANLITGLGNVVKWSVDAAADVGKFGKSIGIFVAKLQGIPDASNQLTSTTAQLKAVNAQIVALQQGVQQFENRRSFAGFGANTAEIDGTIKHMQAKIAQLKIQRDLLQKAQKEEQKTGNTPFKIRGTVGSESVGSVKPVVISSDQIAATLKLLKDSLDRQQKELDAELAAHTVSFKQYYAERTAIAQKGIDDEIAAEREKLKAVVDDAGKRAAILANITILERKRADVAVHAAHDQQAAEKKLTDQLADVRNKTLELTGHTAEAQIEELNAKYAPMIAQLKANGDAAGAAAVQNYKKIQIARAQLDQLEKQADTAIQSFHVQSQTIDVAQKSGTITAAQAREKLNDSYKKTLDLVTQLFPKMEALAKATGDPQALLRVKQMEVEIGHLGVVTDNNATRIKGALSDSFSDLFTNIASGTESVKDAFSDFFKSLDESLSRIAAQNIAQKLFPTGKSASGAGGAGNLFSEFGSWLAKTLHFAEGGQVIGPGTGTSDSIPARLSNGEFVMRAAAVNRIGVNVLNAMNNWRMPTIPMGPRLNYAAGGLVVAPRAPQTGNGLTVVNQFTVSGPVDKRSQQQIAAAAGEGIQRALKRNR